MWFVVLLLLSNVALVLFHVGTYLSRHERNEDLSDVLPTRKLRRVERTEEEEESREEMDGTVTGSWESAAWANAILVAAWPRISPAASLPLAEFLADEVLPGVQLLFLKQVTLQALSFGSEPPIVDAVRAVANNPNGEASLDVRLRWHGKPKATFRAELGIAEASVDVSIADVELSGILRIATGPLVPSLPVLTRLRFSLLPGYDLKFGVTVPKVLGDGIDVLRSFPKLAPTIMSAIRNAVGEHLLSPRYAEWELPVEVQGAVDVPKDVRLATCTDSHASATSSEDVTLAAPSKPRVVSSSRAPPHGPTFRLRIGRTAPSSGA